MADQRDDRARLEIEADVLENGYPRVVLEAHVLERDPPAARRQGAGARGVADRLGLVEDLEDPLSGCGRALDLPDPHPEHSEREDQHEQVDVERDERPERELPLADEVPAGEEHGGLREERQEAEGRRVEGLLPGRPDGLGEDRLGALLEPRLLRILLAERLDDVHPDDRLLGDRGHVADALLDLAEHRMRDVAVAPGDGDQKRRDRQRDQGEAPVDHEQEHGHADDGEHVLDEEDQPVAEEEAHVLEVDRCARHQLAGLVAVEEAVREAQQMPVQGVPEIELDAERLPSGDEAAPDHEQRLEHAEDDDQADEGPEALLVSVEQGLVDDLARQPGDHEAGGLRGHGECDRDAERPPVGPQECQQADERPEPRGLRGAVAIWPSSVDTTRFNDRR